MPQAQTKEAPFEPGTDNKIDDLSPTEMIHKFLQGKGMQPTSENIRRLLEANARERIIPQLVNQLPPDLEQATQGRGGGAPKLAVEGGKWDEGQAKKDEKPAEKKDEVKPADVNVGSQIADWAKWTGLAAIPGIWAARKYLSKDGLPADEPFNRPGEGGDPRLPPPDDRPRLPGPEPRPPGGGGTQVRVPQLEAPPVTVPFNPQPRTGLDIALDRAVAPAIPMAPPAVPPPATVEVPGTPVAPQAAQPPPGAKPKITLKLPPGAVGPVPTGQENVFSRGADALAPLFKGIRR